MKKINFKEGAEIIRNGGIVIYPTDTAYGIGCRVDDEKAVKKLFEIRKRPETKAVPVLFDSIAKVKEFILPIDSKVDTLMEKYWPGGLTVVLKCRKDKIVSLVRGGGESLGVRIPDYEELTKMIEEIGVPVVGTSANFAGDNTPFLFEELNKKLVELVDGVIDMPSKGNETSTVVDCTSNNWKILRQGAISLQL